MSSYRQIRLHHAPQAESLAMPSSLSSGRLHLTQHWERGALIVHQHCVASILDSTHLKLLLRRSHLALVIPRTHVLLCL